jgi:hypothetical protein
MLAGILILLALVAGTVGLTTLTANNLLATRKQDTRADALSVAEAGADQVIAVFNQVENRKMLVSGERMNQWSSADFTSPCRDKSNNPPPPPTAAARSLGDGQFRDLDTLVANTGDRRFALKSVTFAAGQPGSANRRSDSRTTTAGSSTSVNQGSFSSDLINLDDPTDTPSVKLPGFNKGFITLTVEGQVLRNGVVQSTATVTREFEVLPKCCGASLGSNGSGGLAAADPSQSVGGESRFCGVEFGMIVGLNGGTIWSNAANDRFTKRVSSTKITDISNAIGIVAKDGDPFDRASNRVVPNAFSTTVPDPCDPARWTGGTCGSSTWVGLKNATPGAFYGTKDDILGTSISGIPIIPSAITLPAIGSQLTTGKYNFTWTSGSGPSSRVATTKEYATLNPPGASGYKFRFRTRNDTSPPRIEVCNESPTSLGGTNGCTSTTWHAISGTAGAVNNFETFTGMLNGSTATTVYRTGEDIASQPNWRNIGSTRQWYGMDGNNNDVNSTAGNVQYISGGGQGYIRIGLASGNMTAQQNGICRAAILNGNLGRATFSFKQSGSTAIDPSDQLWVQVRTDAGTDTTQCTGTTGTNITSNWVTVAKFPGVNSGAKTNEAVRVVSLADYQSSTTRVRIVNGTNTTTGEFHVVDDINLSLSDWCEYSASSPASAAPGFHCLGPHFNLSVDTSLWTSSPAGGQVYIDTSGGPVSFYYTRTDDLRGNSFTDINPTVDSNPLISVGNGGFLRLVECTGAPSDNCTTPVPENDVALVGDPDNLNIFGRDSGPLQIINFGVVSTSTGFGRISGAWFYMPVGYFELKSYGCAGYNPPGTGPGVTADDSWIFNGRIWTQSFKPCGDIHIRVPPSSAANLGAVVAASSLLDDINFVPWTGVDWVARSVTNSQPYSQ